MTQTSGFYTTSGTPAGHQVSSYTQVIAAKAWAILAACSNFEGVASSYQNELVGSVPGANTARIGTGGAVVDGQWYDNDAAVDVTIPSAVGGGNTRIDRIVLRITWANFEVVITRIAGVDAASPTAPAITQTPGTTYDIMLYQALVNTSGVVTLTDERAWARDQQFYRRQGGSASDWSVAGVNNYSPGKERMQGGVTTLVVGNGTTNNSVSITFPQAFSNKPFILVTQSHTGTGVVYSARILNPSTTGFTIYVERVGTTGNMIVDLHWLAIGPE